MNITDPSKSSDKARLSGTYSLYFLSDNIDQQRKNLNPLKMIKHKIYSHNVLANWKLRKLQIRDKRDLFERPGDFV